MKRDTKTILKAAHYMESVLTDDRGICNALWVAQRNNPARNYQTPLHQKFHAMFPWSEDYTNVNFNRLPNEDKRDVRVVALCFLAAMAETGDL